NGPVKLQSLSGSIVVNPGTSLTNGVTANGTGDILLQAVSGNVTANAGITSSIGNITLDASGTLNSSGPIQTGGSGTVYLSSGSNIAFSSMSTGGGNLQILSGGDLTLGSINAGTGRVYLQASGDIKDSDSNTNSTNVIASALAMKATGKIGDSDTNAPVNTNRNAIGTQVATLAAQSASGIYVQEADGVTIDSVTVSTDRVNFNSTRTSQSQSLEDLSTTNNGPVKLQSLSGSIVVNPGTAGTNGITANGSGDILLQTVSSGTIVTNAVVQSDFGHITLLSKDALNIVDLLRTGAPGTIYLSSDSDVEINTLNTNTNLQIISGSNLTLGSINSGTGRVYLQASGDIKDSDSNTNSTNIIASAVAMKAGGKIGDSDTNAPVDTNRNAIGTQVTTLAAQSANGIYVQEADGVTIDSVAVSTDRVNFNSTRTGQAQSLEDLSTTNNGPVKLQ
ncbi:MAG: hypothetical protein WCP62_18045, partial [Planctomycetota bacterium]